MGRVIHFEIPVGDGERAREFYRRMFGWTIEGESEEGYWLAGTGKEDEPGIDGALITRSDLHAHPVIVVGVESVDRSLAIVQEAGGEVLLDKHHIPSVGYSAYLRDPEGNVVGLFEALQGEPSDSPG